MVMSGHCLHFMGQRPDMIIAVDWDVKHNYVTENELVILLWALSVWCLWVKILNLNVSNLGFLFLHFVSCMVHI